MGQQLEIGGIAAHLTGQDEFPNAIHNVIADAINQRLAELAAPAAVRYRRAP